MSALSIQPTYPIFTDIDGQPLEDGFVWIGQANLDPQVNPINVFWDAALTIPAGQPIRTLGGYPANSGTPARLYVDGDYSIRVMNKNGSVVYSSAVPTERYASSLISYKAATTNAVGTTVEDDLQYLTVSLNDYLVMDDGFDQSAKIQQAIDDLEAAGGGKLVDGWETKTITISNTINLKPGVIIELPNTSFTWGGNATTGTMFDADFDPTPTALFFRIRRYDAPEGSSSTVICLKLNRVAAGDIRLGGRGGGYAIYSTASYNYRIRNLDVGNVAQAGFYHQGDLGAEIYMSDCYISFGGGFVGKYGVFLERTTTGDIGGYYFDNVLVAKGPALQATLDAGIYVKATTFPTTMAIQMRAGGVDGAFDTSLGRYSIRLDNIATAFFTGSWFDKVGFSRCDSMVFTGCNVASGFYFVGSTNTSNFLASNISCGETTAFNFDAGATTSDMIWDNIRTFPGFQLSNDMAKLTAGASAHQNRTVTNSTDQDGAICWQNASDPTKRFYWRVNAAGNMVLLDATFGGEILILTQNGDINILGGTNPGLLFNAVRSVGPRKTGWLAPTGTSTKTGFDTATVTTSQLAERVKALLEDLRDHGLIGNF